MIYQVYSSGHRVGRRVFQLLGVKEIFYKLQEYTHSISIYADTYILYHVRALCVCNIYNINKYIYIYPNVQFYIVVDVLL